MYSVICLVIFNVLFSKQKDRRRKHSDNELRIEENYEQHLSKRRRENNDDNVEVRSLLPIKCKEMGIIRRTIQISKCEFNSRERNIFMLLIISDMITVTDYKGTLSCSYQELFLPQYTIDFYHWTTAMDRFFSVVWCDDICHMLPFTLRFPSVFWQFCLDYSKSVHPVKTFPFILED